ncbi:MAG: HD domain-containing protein [Gammaproteobacteria bacterium]|nr:HD domain-containing protein [Gammaproteobacteria bacterium]
MAKFEDQLKGISQREFISEKMSLVFHELNKKFNFIDRISIALYDNQCDTLTTYIHCSKDASPLNHYQAKLGDSKSLQQIACSGEPRIINDMSVYDTVKKHHSIQIKKGGFKSSYTYPIYNRGLFYGFIFINSGQLNAFSDEVLAVMSPLAHLIAAFTIIEFSDIQTLTATVTTALEMTHQRDPETGEHLSRMARYSRLIALEVASKYQMDDEAIEHIFLFAPLHDVGKISIPDSILLKPGRLDETEFEQMKSHCARGLEIINKILSNYKLDHRPHINILKNIVRHHHEKINGSGYPDGLAGNAIPIEARIVAVADVFDALTSKRPYKEAWSNQNAYAELERLSGEELDEDCVNALLKDKHEIEQIQLRFQEDYIG